MSAMISERNYLSKEKYTELEEELQDLKTNRRREVAERLEFAKSLGDLSENAEYHAAREEQSEIEDRINQLEALLKSSEIIEMHHSVAVELGSTLKVKKLSDNTEQTFTIVGSEEADLTADKISYLSPIGSSLLGKKKGEEVAVRTPKGEVRYKITNIE
jgi:transcription elongation factor GreA